MLKLSCPSCGAEVDFRSKTSVFAVCNYCKSTLVRQDMDLSAIGKMAELQDDLTPFQLGTTGKYDGRKFEIIGRLRVAYDEGFWNEWYVLFDGEKTGWLAEAQGFLAMCVPLKPIDAPPRSSIKPGKTLSVDGDCEYLIEDAREVKCVYSEGELPINAAKGRESLSVDLTGPENSMGTIEYAEKEIRIYFGAYVDFDEFHFANLRQIDGW